MVKWSANGSKGNPILCSPYKRMMPKRAVLPIIQPGPGFVGHKTLIMITFYQKQEYNYPAPPGVL
jgi:hypothetical protein